MTDREVLEQIARVKRAHKTALTRAATWEAQETKKAWTFFRGADTDVEQTNRENALARIAQNVEKRLFRAQSNYEERLSEIRREAGEWIDLVPEA